MNERLFEVILNGTPITLKLKLHEVPISPSNYQVANLLACTRSFHLLKISPQSTSHADFSCSFLLFRNLGHRTIGSGSDHRFAHCSWPPVASTCISRPFCPASALLVSRRYPPLSVRSFFRTGPACAPLTCIGGATAQLRNRSTDSSTPSAHLTVGCDFKTPICERILSCVVLGICGPRKNQHELNLEKRKPAHTH